MNNIWNDILRGAGAFWIELGWVAVPFALGILILGGVLLLRAWSAFRRWRLVRSTPTTPIRRLQPGLAEVIGTLRAEATHPSPISGVPCLFSLVIVEVGRSSGNNRYWVEVGRYSEGELALVEDETGRALVDTRIWPPYDVKLAVDRYETQGFFRDQPKEVQAFLDRVGIEQNGLIFDLDLLQVREVYLVDGDPLYFLGQVESAGIDAPAGVDWCLVPSKSSKPTLIADTSQVKLLGQSLGKAVTLGLIAILVLALPFALLWWFGQE